MFQLYCSDNNLTALDLSGLTNLSSLYCSGNNLTELDLSSLTSLNSLYCNNNNLTALDLSGLTNLGGATVSNNYFASMDAITGTEDIPGFVAWDMNHFIFSPQKEVVPAYNPGDIAVINAIIENNGLDWPPCPYEDGDLGADPAWMATNWPGVQWSEDATDRRVAELYLFEWGLTGLLDLSGLTSLERLDCYGNNLTELNLSGLTNLWELGCGNNNLTALDLSGLTNLKKLYCGENSLTALDFSGLTNLEELFCHENNLTELDLSGMMNLVELSCVDNNLTTLNLSGLTNLGGLWCSNNNLTTLNLSGLTSLYVLNCSENDLTALNLSGLVDLYLANVSNNSFPNTDALSGTDSIPRFIQVGGWDAEDDWGFVSFVFSPQKKRGDANCDTLVNAADAAAILRHLVRLQTLSAQGLLNAKVTDGSGPVSAADAAKILRWLVRLEKTL